MSAFVLEDGVVYHTYSTYSRGLDGLWGMYQWLDRAPKGRNETGPRYNMTDWVRHHDRYHAGGSVDATGRYVAANTLDPCGCAKN